MVLRDRVRLVIGSFGIGVAATGLLLFIGQMYRAVETGHLEPVVVRHVLEEPFVRRNVPLSVSEALRRTSSAVGLDGALDWMLDEFPLPLFLMVLGGVAAWRSLSSEVSVSHKR